MDLKEFDKEVKKLLSKYDNYNASIVCLRNLLDEITNQLIDIINERIIVVKKIGELKKEYSVPIVDKNREEQIMKYVEEVVEEKNKELKKITGEELDADLIKKLMEQVIEYSVKLEQQ